MLVFTVGACPWGYGVTYMYGTFALTDLTKSSDGRHRPLAAAQTLGSVTRQLASVAAGSADDVTHVVVATLELA